jgi:hypothetical protein
VGETIGEKADHVRRAKRAGVTGGHHCHWPGCEKKVPPAMWGCTFHWYKLPMRLRNKIWHAYRTGQEITKTPSGEYVEIAVEVRNWILGQEMLK